MTRATYIAAAAAVTSLAVMAPVHAEAARCPQGQIYRVTQGVCVSKAAAIRQGIYKPRRVNRVRSVRRAAPRPPRAVRSIAISQSRQLKIELLAWAQRNRAWIVEKGL